MKPCETRKKRVRITKAQERLFRDALGEGNGTEQAANEAGLTERQIALRLNPRPRETLRLRCPADKLDDVLR